MTKSDTSHATCVTFDRMFEMYICDEKQQYTHVKSKVNSTSTHLIISALHRVDLKISERVKLMKKLIINIETLILHIAKMKANKFVTCVNKYAIATRYDVWDYKVCELKDEK